MNTAVLALMRHPGFWGIKPYTYHRQYNDTGTPRVLICVGFEDAKGEWFDGCSLEDACLQALSHPTIVGPLPMPAYLEDALLVLSRPFRKIERGSRAIDISHSLPIYGIWITEKEKYTAYSWADVFSLAAKAIRAREGLPQPH